LVIKGDLLEQIKVRTYSEIYPPPYKVVRTVEGKQYFSVIADSRGFQVPLGVAVQIMNKQYREKDHGMGI
jgi:hypothetical protein